MAGLVLGLLESVRYVALRHREELRQEAGHQVAVAVVANDEIRLSAQLHEVCKGTTQRLTQ